MKAIAPSEAVFTRDILARDEGRCVVCGEKAVGVHCLFQPELWDEGSSWQADNGVSLCLAHLSAAIETTLSVGELRAAARVRPVAPDHLSDPHETFDTWGNPILPSGARLRGELWWSEACQAALGRAGLLSSFSPYIKYPRTMHLPWSPGLQNDDRRLETMNGWAGREVVITEKMDGENTTLYRDYLHARSIDSKHHASRTWIKSLHATIAHEIPADWRICGENLYAVHSLAYADLRSYFYVFNIWERGACLSWDETCDYARLLGLDTVPVLYRGPWSEAIAHEVEANLDPARQEGYVVRATGRIRAGDWRRLAAKWVRAGHVQTDQFWMSKPVVPNALAAEIPQKVTP